MSNGDEYEPATLYSDTSEQSVLGGLLLDNEAYDQISSVVRENDFYMREHRLIFRAILSLLENNRPVDIVTLAEVLDSFRQLDEVGGVVYLGQLAQDTPTSANIAHYAQTVRDHSLLRQMAAISTEITQKIYKRDGQGAAELLDFAQSRWMQVSDSMVRAKNSMQHVREVMDSVTDMIQEAVERGSDDDITGLRTGLDDLDKLISGLNPGDLFVLGGRPSMGKTSLAMNIAEHVALNEKVPVAVFSLEMVNKQLGTRLLASVSRLNVQRMRVGRLNENEWDQLSFGLSKLTESDIYLDEESSLSVMDIRSRARRLHRQTKGKLGLIVIDYLQLMSVNDSDNRANALGEVSRGLKRLAKELNLPVIALSQLSRAVDQRPNKRPVMSDLRESGAIEQDADIIGFVYRDEYYNPDSADKGTAEIIIAKQRNGPINTVRASFVPHLTRFENYEGGYQGEDHE